VAASSVRTLNKKGRHEQLHHDLVSFCEFITILIYLIVLILMPEYVGVISVTLVIIVMTARLGWNVGGDVGGNGG
jgi:fatty-acid desaturase